jgi:hypothetical protein
MLTRGRFFITNIQFYGINVFLLNYNELYKILRPWFFDPGYNKPCKVQKILQGRLGTKTDISCLKNRKHSLI